MGMGVKSDTNRATSLKKLWGTKLARRRGGIKCTQTVVGAWKKALGGGGGYESPNNAKGDCMRKSLGQ